ncbi:unnamed protein product [Malus baccata var. baccata]
MSRLNMAITVVPIVLNRKNYDDWSSRIKTYLLAKDLWDVVHLETEDKENAQSRAWKKKDAKALYAIQNSCGDDTYKLIKDKTTAKEAWDTLYQKLKPGHDERPLSQKDRRPVIQAFPTQTDHDATPELTMEEGRTGGANSDNGETFVNYVVSLKWNDAIKFLCDHPDAGSAIISDGGTALHYAIWNLRSCSARIIEQLVGLMTREDLQIKDSNGLTALHHLIRCYPERVEVAESMVKKNRKLLTILDSEETPLVVEAQSREKGERMANYLFSETPPETLEVTDAAQLISLDIVLWDLIQHYPKLVMVKDYNGDFPLITLASKPSPFSSGSRFGLLEKLIYHGIRIKPLPFIDSRVNVQKPESDQRVQGWLICLENDPIYKMKLVHERIKQFLPLICKVSEHVESNEMKSFDIALCVAAERGNVEYITHFLKDPSHHLDDIKNEKGQNLLQIAAECRQRQVFDLIYVLYDELKEQRKYGKDQFDRIRDRVGKKDHFGNNMLHTVACISSLSKIDHTQGAALQMQRELQWFKEVESIAYPKDCESVNKDNMTPREVFTENHKEMEKEAKSSIKETATSCSVVSALIVTLMFAAVFKIPSGKDGNNGVPGGKLSTALIVLDAISLFSSTTSVIIFLNILTSSYSEDDLWIHLPDQMMMGLFTLLLSIVSMISTFSCVLYIELDGKLWVVISCILFVSVPLSLFILKKSGVLFEILISTYGPIMFREIRKWVPVPKWLAVLVKDLISNYF